MSYLVPHFIFDSYSGITPDFLLSKGIKFVLCDIDNTLVTYDDPEPTKEVTSWLCKMKNAGIEIIFLSNNEKERVTRFARDTGYKGYADSGKPLTGKARKIMKEAGALQRNTAVLGDQIYTDMLLGARLGLSLRIFVPPIKDKKTLFFRFKRLLERPVLYRYNRMHKKT